MADFHEPLILIVSGPSASGKSTLVKKLLELPGMLWSVSCTTRPLRHENDKGWYNFIAEDEFRRKIERGEFLEYACVFGKHWYGTPKRWLDEAKAKGLDLVLEIDVQGATQVKGKHPESVAIFVVPPSAAELEKRIRARGQNSEEEIARRLVQARQEIQRYDEYDYVVVNGDIERAGREVQAIAIATRCRRVWNEQRARQILELFGGSAAK